MKRALAILVLLAQLGSGCATCLTSDALDRALHAESAGQPSSAPEDVPSLERGALVGLAAVPLYPLAISVDAATLPLQLPIAILLLKGGWHPWG